MMAPEPPSSAPPPGVSKPETIIVGISGPSSSGKTTIARLLRRIFPVSWGDDGSDDAGIETFLIHEDDFYFTDDKYEISLCAGDILLSSHYLQSLWKKLGVKY